MTKKDKDKLFENIFYMSLWVENICRNNKWKYFFEVSRESDFEKGVKNNSLRF